MLETNLLEVMPFVVNDTTFDPNNEIKQGVLAAYKPLAANLAIMGQQGVAAKLKPYWFEPNGKTNLDALVATLVIGPIGLPPAEAEYPAVTTTEAKA